MQRVSVIIRSIYALCLLGAAFNHARILLRHGLFWDYGGVAWPSAAYWTGLTVLDPLVAILLFVRPKIGIIGTLVLIGTNVAHNLTIAASRAPPGEFLHHLASDPFLQSQLGFLLFVGATAHLAWRGLADPRAVSPERPHIR
jgi:hypothetical protein